MFQIKTNEAHIFKTFSELLHNNYMDITYFFTEKGIEFPPQKNESGNIMIEAFMKRQNFIEYEIDNPVNISLSAQHISKMTKSIKKKDVMTLVLDNQSLQIITENGDSKVNKSFVLFNYVNTFTRELVPEYDEHIPVCIVDSIDFQKMCKLMNSISKQMVISIQEKAIKFEGKTEQILIRQDIFGKWDTQKPIIETFTIPTRVFYNISKCSGLAKKLRFYYKPDQTLRISCDAGNLLQLNIYVYEPEDE
jgi:hypothetical protein